MAVEGSTRKKTLRSPFCHIRGRIKTKKKKTFTDLRPGLTDHAHPGCAPARVLSRGTLPLCPTSFLPLLLSFKSCCSESLLLSAADTQASQEDWRAFSRNWSVGEACTESAPCLPWMKRPRPRAASSVAGPPLSSLGSQVPTPPLPPPSPADRAGRRPSGWARCGDGRDAAASVLWASLRGQEGVAQPRIHRHLARRVCASLCL